MDGETMSKQSLLGVLLASLLVTVPMAGCFDEISDAINGESWGKVGGLTLACLRSDTYSKMVVEIDYAPGYAPESSTVSLLKQRLEQVCDKPNGISMDLNEYTFSETSSWNADLVRSVAHDTMDGSPLSGSTLRWHVIMPQGSYSDDSVLGVAVDASTIALFGDSIDDANGLFNRPSSEEVENSVMIHEFGHLLGLVNLVYTSPADHEDADHPGHSNNDDSVMYWAVESQSLGAFFSGDLPSEFDEDDLADMEGMKSGDIPTSDQLWRP